MVQRFFFNHYLARTAGMLSGARRASLMLLVMLLTTSTAWAQDPATIGSISYNNSISAYEINSVANLNDLAVYVNGSGTYSIGGDESNPHTCSGLSFKMTAPITYDGSVNNYTPIGNISQSFDGTFDGQGKTISGININNTSATYQAIFGSVEGTVKNLVVSNCSIVASQQVGAIAGTIQGLGTIENCSVGNDVTLSGNSGIGGISGENDGSTIKGCTCAATINGTKAGGFNAYYLGGIAGSASGAGGTTPYLTDNLFTGAIGGNLDEYIGAIVGWSNSASLTNNIYTSTGFGGIGAASSTTGADGFGASRPYSVTFDENGGTAVPDLKVALGTVISAPATTREGYTLTGWKNGSTDFDFSTPVTSDLELTAQWAIPYIDKNGNTAYCTNYTVLNNTMTTISAGWYVVNSDVTFSGNLSTNADGEVYIILCDGATLTANNIKPQTNSDKLRIYGQSQGTGTANISGNIMGNYSVSIYGGTINAAGDIDCAQGSISIYGGTVTARSLVALNTGSQIRLGGATVKANSYSAPNGVTILTGITYYDGTGASYTAGDLDAGQISAIRGKTLRTYDYRGGTCGMTSSDDVTWLYNVSTKTLTISGTGAMYDYVDSSKRPWNSYTEQINEVVIENGVTSIGEYAFFDCQYLTSVTFAEGSHLETIGNSAFDSTALTLIEISASVTSIGESAFFSCDGLTSVSFAEGSQLENIGNNAFRLCSNLTSITIPASVTSIGSYVFQDCENLASMAVADGNTVYDSRNGCNAIIETLTNKLIIGCKNSTIPTSVTSIGAWAFCTTCMTSIEIPASVTSIGGRAFMNCLNLATVTVYAPSCTLGDNAFFNCNKLENIYVFSDLVDTYKGAENWSGYAEKITGITGGYCGATGHETDVVWALTGESTNYTLTISGTGAMADYAEASGQPWTAMHSDINAIVIEDGVTSIGNYAFSLCEYVTSGVSIPTSVTSIGNYSFNYCSMTSLTIPSNSSLETIGSFAFNCCSSLPSVTFPASVKSIGNNAFDGSANLTTVTLNSNPFIGESAFYSSTAVTMNLTANGPVDGAYWTTFYNKNYNFQTDATNMFKAALSGTTLTLTELATDQIVNKDNAVILKSTASPIVMTLTTDGSNDFTGNSLQGVDDPAGLTAADPSTTYVLNNGTNGVGFYKLKSGKTLGVGKAYLTYTGTLAPGFFGFDEGTTGITNTDFTDSTDKVGAWYDLQGRKIANGQKPTAKGLYIVNGKKVMIK